MRFKTIVFSMLMLLLPAGVLPSPSPKPLSVLIIGGGPAGLATAIEANYAGAAVTIIEKRETYSRPQTLFLLDTSIRLFKKWQISPSQMRTITLEDDLQFGFVKINHLEESLSDRVSALGIQKVHGEFTGFGPNQTARIRTSDDKLQSLSYDIIVAADGAHSLVRNSLPIEMHHLGAAIGAFAFIVDPTDTSTIMDISSPIEQEESFVRRIKVPSFSLLFTQSPQGDSKEELQRRITQCGWEEEARLIGENKAFIATDIPVILQQARTFSSQDKSAILVGDAASTASFFQGMGANTAFTTAAIAGQFFQSMQQKSPSAYQDFNGAMKEATDSLIEDSAFLFPKAAR